MSRPDEREQFHRDVFPAELEEINKRRQRLQLPEAPPGDGPSVRLGLVGLALSGGGLRSATFSLGVIQALAKHGLLKSVDYLSTVSGGGFIGSCLSSLLNDPAVGPEQERFPLRYQVGSQEPLAVGQLRQGARYLAPGGLLDKLRILTVALRGVLSNMLIFLFLILLFVFLTELVYEVGNRVRLPFGYLVLGGVVTFVILVIGSPLMSRLLRGRSSWAQRNLEEMTFTVLLMALLFLVFLVPLLIFIDQALDTSWVEAKKSITADLLRPFEPRDYLQWLAVLVLIVVFMLAGRASAQVARIGGKIMLFILGLLGPAFLFLIYLGLLAMEIDSPFITANELFSLDAAYADQLRTMDRISPELRLRFKENNILLSKTAQLLTLQEDLRWLIHDGKRAFSLVREQDGVSVTPDFQYALNRGKIPHDLRVALAKKGFQLDPTGGARPERSGNRFKIFGSHVYWVNHDATRGEWSLEQVVASPALSEVLQSASYTLPIADPPPGVLIHERVWLSDDDIEQAIRFVEEADPHDIVLLIDNSVPPFTDRAGFKRAFRQGLEQTMGGVRPTVHMAVLTFDENVHVARTLEVVTPETNLALFQTMFGDGNADLPRLDFEGRRSNIPAGLVRAMRELMENGRPRVRKSIILISDGVIGMTANGHDKVLQDWIEQELTRDAEMARIRLYGIALSSHARFDLFDSMAKKTGGAYYPFFQSGTGHKFQDMAGAMLKLKEAAGGFLVSPLDQVTITDGVRGTTYTLTRAKDGVGLRATLQDDSLAPTGLPDLSDRWREVFSENGIDLSEEATVTQVADGRWEVRDPYLYTISRSGRRLKITPGAEDVEQGFIANLEAGLPSSLWDDSTDWVFLGLFGILFVYWMTVDINLTAAHRFYRDRLSKAYLFRVTRSGTVEHHDKEKLSELNTEGGAAPYHVINVALNLQATKDPSLRGRYTDFFIFSKRFTGCQRTGFLETREMEDLDGNLDLGTAMAISGAAAAPNAGVTTLKPLVFIMTLLNLRLGYWLPNPCVVKEASWLTRLAIRRGPGPKYVLKESLGRVDARGRYVNVSDGGHIENLGLYELLRRRCQFIIAVDGGRDPELSFGHLVNLLLYARIDLGIEVDLDLDPIRKNAEGLSSAHWALGTIRYAGGETGYLLYVKGSLTGDEYEYVREYRSKNPNFPHESTADQFFTEARFEAYRALGYHIGDELFGNDEALGEFTRLKAPGAGDRTVPNH